MPDANEPLGPETLHEPNPDASLSQIGIIRQGNSYVIPNESGSSLFSGDSEEHMEWVERLVLNNDTMFSDFAEKVKLKYGFTKTTYNW